jgi:hypothetical protein
MNNSYQTIAITIANLVSEKNEAYGSSFSKSQQFLEILYPNGIAVSQYKDMLTIARIFDKLMRIANRKDAFGESPYGDILGYALLMLKEEVDADVVQQNI